MNSKIFKIGIFFTVLSLTLTACGAESSPNNTSAIQDSTAGNTSNQPEPEAVQPPETPAHEEPAAEQPDTVSFSEDVLPILQSRCMTCHGGERIEGDLVMLSYAELMAGGENGAAILQGDGEGSLLYQLASSGKMPKRGANLTPVQLDVIFQWINAGALDN